MLEAATSGHWLSKDSMSMRRTVGRRQLHCVSPLKTDALQWLGTCWTMAFVSVTDVGSLSLLRSSWLCQTTVRVGLGFVGKNWIRIFGHGSIFPYMVAYVYMSSRIALSVMTSLQRANLIAYWLNVIEYSNFELRSFWSSHYIASSNT